MIQSFVDRRMARHRAQENDAVRREGLYLEARRADNFAEIRRHPLPDVPVHVLVGGRFDMPERFRSRAYDDEALFYAKIQERTRRWSEMVQTGAAGRLFYSARAGHYVQWDDPELVVASIELILREHQNTDTLEREKAAILAVLNGETAAAFQRDYPRWRTHWVHADYVTKTYINFAEGTATESLGWTEIDDFVRTYIEAHPEPDPLPELLDEIEVRLLGNGAWVSYEQIDATRGRKRETRLMERIDGQWKIAGMHTTIYGQ